jgi:hypothetical protein
MTPVCDMPQYTQIIVTNLRILFQYSALVYRFYCYFNICGHGFSSGTPEDGWIQPKHVK